MNNPDVIVIGAGTGGVVAAWLLASEGLDVLLVDRASFPRPKLCGGCLATSGARTLERIGLAPELPSLSRSSSLGSLNLRSGARSTTIRVPEYRVIDRARFDHDIVKAAICRGARFLDAASARVSRDGSVTIGSSGAETHIAPRAIIVADGLSGTSLKHDDRFSWSTKRQGSRVGIGTTTSNTPPEIPTDAITMLHSTEGYLGIAPMHDGRCVIAAAVDPNWVRRAAPGGALRSIVHTHGLDWSSFGTPGRTVGAPELTRTRSRVEADARVFLLGDATGYIEPFTGEGMSWAINHAVDLTPFVLDALSGRYSQGQWAEAIARAGRRRTLLCSAVTRACRSPRLVGAVMSACNASKGVSGLVSRAVTVSQSARVMGTA